MSATDRRLHWLNVVFPEAIDFPGRTEGIVAPAGSTGQRPAPPVPGTIRYNTTNAALEVYIGAPTNAWEEIAGGSGGFVRTASNVGSGEGVFKQKAGTDLEFKSILGSGNITITDLGDELQIATAGAAGEANTASNIGGAIGVFNNKVGVDLQFKSLNSLTTDLTIVDSGTTVDLDLVGAPYLPLAGGTMTGSITMNPGATVHGSSGQTAAIPAFNFTADFNSGMFSPAVNTIGFSTNSTEKSRIAPNGALTVPAGYEALVIADTIIPNKKYVDDAIIALANVNVYRQAFTAANIISGTVQFAHNLGQLYVQVTVYDNFNKVIIPEEITTVNSNIIDVDLKTFGTLVGNWHVVVMG